MSKMDSFMTPSLLTTISRKVTLFSDISAVEFDARVEFVSLFNKMIQVFFYHCPRGRRCRQYIVSILFGWFRFIVSILAMKILANDTAIL